MLRSVREGELMDVCSAVLTVMERLCPAACFG